MGYISTSNWPKRCRVDHVALILMVCLVVLPGLELSAAEKATVTASGYAMLDGESDHAGISVVFNGDSPSAVSDSTLTDSDGYYALAVEVGVYDVDFHKDGFFPDSLDNQTLISSTVLDSIQLIPATTILAGDLNGILEGPGLYYVGGNVTVQAGDTLTVEPGAELRFMGPYYLEVYGLLLAQGSETEPIVFTSSEVSPAAGDWTGLKIWNTADENSVFQHCEIRFADIGLWIRRLGPTVRQCTVTDANIGISCSAGGGAVPTMYITIEDCLIERCSSSGIYESGNSATVITGCTIRECDQGIRFQDNDTRDAGSISNCVFENNTGVWGAGIYCSDYVRSPITDCLFRGNMKGIYVANTNYPTIERCIFLDNEVGVFVAEAAPIIRNNTFFQNVNIGIGFSQVNATAQVSSNIIAGSLYPFGGLPANTVNSSFTYNCVDGENPLLLPANVGTLIFTNANGDSCDLFYNIFQDPQLTDPSGGDFSLINSSPCIDAGDLLLPLNPDGTLNDIGAIYFDQSLSPVPGLDANWLVQLRQNAPNPFNPSTRIEFTTRSDLDIRIRIFDIAGRVVNTIVNWEKRPAGKHRVTWNGVDDFGARVASGVYFYRLEAGPYSQTKRMVLVK